MQLKKRILRTVLVDIVLDRDRDSSAASNYSSLGRRGSYRTASAAARRDNIDVAQNGR